MNEIYSAHRHVSMNITNILLVAPPVSMKLQKLPMYASAGTGEVNPSFNINGIYYFDFTFIMGL